MANKYIRTRDKGRPSTREQARIISSMHASLYLLRINMKLIRKYSCHHLLYC